MNADGHGTGVGFPVESLSANDANGREGKNSNHGYSRVLTRITRISANSWNSCKTAFSGISFFGVVRVVGGLVTPGVRGVVTPGY